MYTGATMISPAIKALSALYVIEYGGLFSCFIRYIAGIYVLRQRRQLVIEFILARYPFLKGHNKSNQLLSALIYSWNSFAFPSPGLDTATPH